MLITQQKSIILSQTIDICSKVSFIFNLQYLLIQNSVSSVYPLHGNISLWVLKLSSCFLKGD